MHSSAISTEHAMTTIIEENSGLPFACSAAIRTADIHKKNAETDKTGKISLLTEYCSGRNIKMSRFGNKSNMEQ